jgi:phosphoribosyl-ATP pyrophosphohydrolase/phosphoribosyl-AMP cyclohydrolase
LYERLEQMPEGSYTSSLYKKGIDKIAQKVGEEAVELVIEAKGQDRERLVNEAADLVYHMMVLLVYKGYTLDEVIQTLKERHR